MKKAKILSVLLSAATTISALSISAGAMIIPEGYEPVSDITQSAEGKLVQLDDGRYFLNSENEPVGNSLIYIDRSNADALGSDMTMFRADKETGKLNGTYTGFTKDKNGRRYYKYGKRIYGWYKVGNSWYHFGENGYADTGKVKLCGGKYTFDEKGKWTGRVTKCGLAPKDFYIEYSCIYEGFNSDGLIIYGEDMEKDYPDDKVTRQVKVSDRDKQVFYAMFLESGFEQGSDYVFDSEDFRKRLENYKTDVDFMISESEPNYSYDIEISYGGKETKISFFYDSRQLIHIEQDYFRADNFTSAMRDYMRDYLCRKYPEPEGISWAGIE